MDPRNTHEKNFGPTKYPREKISELGILTRKSWPHEYTHEKKFWTHEYPREKFWTYEIPTRKNFGPTNTHEKKFRTRKYPREKFLTYEIATRKNIKPTKYPGRHDDAILTIPTIARDRGNLAHSKKACNFWETSCLITDFILI